MSLCLSLTALSDANLEAILRYPPLAWRVLMADDEPYEELAAQMGTKPVLKLPFPSEEPFFGGMDWTWHGIHYLLTGTAYDGDPPLDFLLKGGTPVVEQDMGYGQPRVLMAKEVQAVHDALAHLSDADLRARYAPREMMQAEIYGWEQEPGRDEGPGFLARCADALRVLAGKPRRHDMLGYLMRDVDQLRAFISKVAQHRRGLILYLQ